MKAVTQHREAAPYEQPGECEVDHVLRYESMMWGGKQPFQYHVECTGEYVHRDREALSRHSGKENTPLEKECVENDDGCLQDLFYELFPGVFL